MWTLETRKNQTEAREGSGLLGKGTWGMASRLHHSHSCQLTPGLCPEATALLPAKLCPAQARPACRLQHGLAE